MIDFVLFVAQLFFVVGDADLDLKRLTVLDYSTFGQGMGDDVNVAMNQRAIRCRHADLTLGIDSFGTFG